MSAPAGTGRISWKGVLCLSRNSEVTRGARRSSWTTRKVESVNKVNVRQDLGRGGHITSGKIIIEVEKCIRSL